METVIQAKKEMKAGKYWMKKIEYASIITGCSVTVGWHVPSSSTMSSTSCT